MESRTLTKTHRHHILPRSLGGTDDPENLMLLDPVTHAELHAREFLNGGIQFDFRHEGWGLLDPDLRDAVRAERSRRMKENQIGPDNPMFGKTRPDRRVAWEGDKNPQRKPENREKTRQRVTGEGNPMFGKTGEQNHFFGRTHTEETRRRLSEINRANPNKSMEGKKHTEEAKEKMRGPREKTKGQLWWVNEEGKNQRARECPGPDWQQGRKWRPQ